MTDIRVLFNEQTLLLKKSFADKAAKCGSAESATLAKYVSMYPSFSIAVHQIKHNSTMEHYSGLSYDYMRWYITHYEVEERRDKMLDVLNKKIDISKCHSTGKRYATIKSWFLTQYPAVKEFGMSAVDKAAEDEAAEIEKKNVIQMEDDVEKMDKAS